MKLGSGVNVLRGVNVRVGVKGTGGSAATVCVAAASAVCTINVPIAFGSSGGIGVGPIKVGTHPIKRDRVMQQISSFVLDDVMFPLCSRDMFHDLFYNFFHAPNGSTLQTDFDPMRVRWRFRKNIFHNTLR